MTAHGSHADAERALEELARGTVTIETRGELLAKLRRSQEKQAPLRIKLGVDPTISDLHLGHAVPLRKLRQFQDRGHTAVLIIGDYTACVGDPSGRNKTRPQLSHADVMAFAATYVEQAFKILDRGRTEVVYNGTWFARMEFLEVIRLASRITVARLLEREDFSKRYESEQPISVHELLYPLMQAYDSVQVRADVELGGTDQTFNLLVGRDLMRQEGLEAQVCVTFPLLVGTDGEKKMSKSTDNYIGISETPEQIFGKTMSIPDAAMESYFTLCTDWPPARVRESLEGNPRAAKAALAREIVRSYHGAEAAARAEAHFDRVFRDREEPEVIAEVKIEASALKEGRLWCVDLIVRAGLAATNNDARRKIEGGGVTYGGARIDDPHAHVIIADGAVLKVGKKNFRRTVLVR